MSSVNIPSSCYPNIAQQYYVSYPKLKVTLVIAIIILDCLILLDSFPTLYDILGPNNNGVNDYSLNFSLT